MSCYEKVTTLFTFPFYGMPYSWYLFSVLFENLELWHPKTNMDTAFSFGNAFLFLEIAYDTP